MSGGPDGGLRALLHRSSPWVHWQAIEVGYIGAGVPDSNGCWSTEFWVECKRTTHWKFASPLEPQQVGWMLRRLRSGGRVMVLCRKEVEATARRPAADELWLMSGWYARELRDAGLRCPPAAVLGRWSGGPSTWPWREVTQLMAAAPLTAPP